MVRVEHSTPEGWRAIRGYEGCYEVSDHGRVRSLTRHVAHSRAGTRRVAGQMIKIQITSCGYAYVNLQKEGRSKMALVHHLVATEFIGEAPGALGKSADDWQINHKNFRRSDNRVDNLEWVTTAQNRRHLLDAGHQPRGSRVGNAKLDEGKVSRIRGLLRSGKLTQKAIARQFEVDKGLISQISRGIVWRHVP